MTTIKISGGDKLEKYLRDKAKELGEGAMVRVGFLEGATYPTGSTEALRKRYARRAKQGKAGAVSGAKGGTPVAMVAAIQNFGSGKIPPRPFFSNMVKDKSPGWPDAIEENLKDTGFSSEKTMERMGDGIKGQLQQSIRDTNSPPNSPKTIARKGFSKPLIDTSHMINSADFEVDTKGATSK